MSHSALVRIRQARSQEPTLRILAFPLRHHWFCVPLAIARRVLPRESHPGGPGIDLIQLQQDNIPVLDAGLLIYGADSPPLAPSAVAAMPAIAPPAAAPQPQNVIVLDLSPGESVGLIIDGIPTLRRVRQSAFSPVPPMYVTVHQLRGLRSVIHPDPQLPDSPTQPMFLLDVEQLLRQSPHIVS